MQISHMTSCTMMGSGGLVVSSESDCMVDVACYFLHFTCDRCISCTECAKACPLIIKSGEFPVRHLSATCLTGVGQLFDKCQTAVRHLSDGATFFIRWCK